ncbi:ferric reductase-like transmembrane domain-containing protein [Jatrophihabitans telluris]|uniref:Ferric reductase-like transmembrane domain-containing protein n=1 Tax=Jatrophihabitans telluris TaxID=2038343 RepID=A0ABY4QYZ6_9ACTN|nr:ferric reductase-like transmembrane domain-containing protein [Jatrophihabitans telluris]UQX88236.1 ferric reductase-like transmembrane domain-containing protein [Jatrophihabitans telluris]
MMPTRARPTPPAATWVPTGPALLPPLALTAMWFGAALALLLWWQDTQYVSGLDGWLTNAGRLTGLLAGYLLALLLALMARVPALERGIGTDRLARWHASLGRYTVCLSVTHALLILWGYSLTAHVNPVSQTSTLLLSYPDVLMATVALGLLVLVGVVSARAARRRMSYETWHFIHLYTYLAVALAFSHQFATGVDFVDNAPARWLWSAMYLSVALTLVWFRFLTPLLVARRHQMRVVAVHRESADTVSVWIGGRQLDRLKAESGQFFRWRFLTRERWWAANPYSLSAVPRPDLLRITVKDLGDHSRDLGTISPGTRVLAEGPFGAFTARNASGRGKVLLLAGGVGITPIRALFESLPAAPGALTLIYRASAPQDVVFAEELQHIAAGRQARLLYLFGPRGSAGRPDPLQADNLLRTIPDLAEHEVYLCGPPGMTDAAQRELRRAGVGRRHVHVESFTF